MAVGHKDVSGAIIVIVHEARSKAAHVKCRISEARAKSGVLKKLIARVLVQSRELFIEVRNDQIHPTFAEHIRRICAHTGFRQSIGAYSNTTEVANFAKSAVTIVVK